MSRSTKKGPYVDPKIIKKVEQMEAQGKRDVIRTWSRSSTISPTMVGHKIEVHNGNRFILLDINESMVGYKLGEFAKTRKFMQHSKKGVKKQGGSDD